MKTRHSLLLFFLVCAALLSVNPVVCLVTRNMHPQRLSAAAGQYHYYPAAFVVSRTSLFAEQADKSEWNDADHLAHGLSQVHLETDDDLMEAESEAAWDAHDCEDAGMEAAAEERAVMWAAKMTQKLKEQSGQPNKADKWNDEHLAHGLSEVQLETDSDLLQAELEAAWDAHDCSDAGMEAAAEERAVMWAAEMTQRLKEQSAQPTKVEERNKWDDEHLAHGLSEVQLETEDDLREAETDAAWDAHDCSDAGMEAAAEERAVMWAAQMTERLKEKARQRKRA